MESNNLKNSLKKECTTFKQKLKHYYETSDEKEKAVYRRIIVKRLKKSSSFSAFKRWIIKENPVYKNDFEKHFD